MTMVRLNLIRFLGIKSPLQVRKEVLREAHVRRAIATIHHGDRVLTEMEALERRDRDR